VDPLTLAGLVVVVVFAALYGRYRRRAAEWTPAPDSDVMKTAANRWDRERGLRREP